MENKKTRLFEISLLNILFCMVVVFAHVSSKAIDSYGEFSTVSPQYLFAMLSQRLSRFVVPGFIFLSGLKMMLNKKDKFSHKKFYIKRLKSVVLPYLAWVVIYYLYDMFTSKAAFDVFKFARGLFLGNAAHLYFVVVIDRKSVV